MNDELIDEIHVQAAKEEIQEFKNAGWNWIPDGVLKFAIHLRAQQHLNKAMLNLLHQGKMEVQFNEENPEESSMRAPENNLLELSRADKR
jgi:hypothetical protein